MNMFEDLNLKKPYGFCDHTIEKRVYTKRPALRRDDWTDFLIDAMIDLDINGSSISAPVCPES